MVKIDINKCELVDCWFYIDHTPPKGQGDWGGAIHKGACKLNSTDCKDTPIEKCLIKSLYEQLQQLKAENEQLYKEKEQLQKSQYCVAYEKDCHLVCKQSGCKLKDYHKYKQCLDEIEEYIYTDCDYNDGCDRSFCIRCKYSNIHDKRILQLIKQAKGG